ncbi:MAG: hypothetical protein IKP47_04200 [Ruminococcus sp.]|nr:hypothetical protein [Ruminococcus sp.]
MSKLKKAAALIACAMTASLASGCSDTRYALTVGEEEVKAGIYIGYLQNQLTTQLNLLYYQGISEDPFSQQIEGVSFSQYIKDYALKSTKEYYAIKKQFEAEGLTLTDEQLKSVNSSINSTWKSMGELYELEGISKESLKELYKTSLWSNALFEHYYGEGGKEAPTDEDLQNYINDSYLRYKMIVVYKSTKTDESEAAKENEEKLKERDTFLEKANGVSFEDFNKIIDEYDAYENAKNAAETTEDDSSTGDSSSEQDSSSEADSSESAADSSSAVNPTPADEESSESSEDESSEADEDESSDDSQDSDESSDGSSEDSSDASSEDNSDASSEDNSSKEDDSSAAEAEEDPYAKEVMVNFADLSDSELESESGKLYKFIKDLELGKATAFENDNGYYIVIKGDVTERTDYLAANRSTVLHAMKDKEYEEKVKSWVEAANIKVNETAIKRYTPEVIYDKMNEYYDKKS